MITENIIRQIREVQASEASQGQRSAVLCKFKTTFKSLFHADPSSDPHVSNPVSAYSARLASAKLFSQSFI